MTVSPGDIIRVSARFKDTISGDIVNVWHWRAAGTGSATDAAIMDAIDAKLSTMFAYVPANLANTSDPYDIRYDKVEWVGGLERVITTLGTRTWVLGFPPSGAGDALPHQDAAIINFRTTQPKTFGRKYIGPLVEAINAAGTLTGAALTGMAQLAAEFLVDITSGTIVLEAGVLSYKMTGDHWTAITAAVVNAITGVQRRRRQNTGS